MQECMQFALGGESGCHMQLVCERLVISLSIPGQLPGGDVGVGVGMQKWYLKWAVDTP